MKLTRKQLALPAAVLCALGLVASGCSSTRSYTTHSASQPGASLAEVGKTIPNPGTTGTADEPTSSAAEPTSEKATTTADSKADAAFPVTVTSCDKELTFDKAPENVVILGVSGAAAMKELGVLDRVKYRTGDIRTGAFDAATQAQLEAIPTIAADKLDTGGSKVSTEALLAVNPDLVVGYETGADMDALDKAGVAFYSPNAFCPTTSTGKASFDLVGRELDTFGKIFGLSDKAADTDGVLKGEVATLVPQGDGLKAAALYITPGSTTFYTYGNSSMVQPILEVNDLNNVYADNSKRVFDASMESLLAENPDWIVLLSDEGTDKETMDTFLGFPGAEDLKAVAQKRVVVLPFALTDPPSPLSVKGAVELNKAMIRSVQ
ncbi:ABC transporter substrate-binding protein [Corynebacterium mendelii]|uniref:ABC transporter substrate-binding protein n=1 Tax=Corynebacterium mendelii TaxID=2765362 RepID=A0A939IWG3_9CORY|nr:ABC transporter substrate-binding protein [Corynebacterium mendelii]MBN9645261.1 ABC transporter substrate-binding protein [Corynebacterium mendelii]